jgi:hypothetical protein
MLSSSPTRDIESRKRKKKIDINKMKIYLIAFALTWTAAASADVWESPQAWENLRRKMTESQVADLLGNPKDTETVGHSLVWYYQDVPKIRDGQITWRPKTAFVHFKQITLNGQNVFMLYGWKPPPFEPPPPPPPPVEDSISPDNPLAQLEQIERVYMEQLQLADPENFNAPTPTQSAPKRQLPAPSVGLNTLSQLFDKLPRQWVLIGIGGICFITALVILWPRRRKRRRNHIESEEPKTSPKWEVKL